MLSVIIKNNWFTLPFVYDIHRANNADDDGDDGEEARKAKREMGLIKNSIIFPRIILDFENSYRAFHGSILHSIFIYIIRMLISSNFNTFQFYSWAASHDSTINRRNAMKHNTKREFIISRWV